MEKGKFTFTKESALQEVGNLIESFKEMKIVNLGNDTYRVFGVLDTSIEQEIQNAIEKAGKLLFCDNLNAEYVIDNKTCQGTAFMYYKREKHIDEQKRIQERFRLHDMLRMALYDYVDYVEFEPPEPMSYTDKYDIVKVVFEMGLKTK